MAGEMNARMSREMETMMDLLHTQISRAINSALSERIIPEIQNMVGNLPLSHYGVEPFTSTNEDGIRNPIATLASSSGKTRNRLSTGIDTNKNNQCSRSACDLRDHADNTPYIVTGVTNSNSRFLNSSQDEFTLSQTSKDKNPLMIQPWIQLYQWRSPFRQHSHRTLSTD